MKFETNPLSCHRNNNIIGCVKEQVQLETDSILGLFVVLWLIQRSGYIGKHHTHAEMLII